MSIRVDGREDKELFMTEIASIAIKNWVDRDDGNPILTDEQLSRVTRRVIAKKWDNNN